jgi:poly(3-hydroxybutyrate) depolymerase
MLYDAYEVQRSFLTGASKLAGLGAGWLTNPANPLAYVTTSPLIAAGLEVFANATAPHGKPHFGIRSVEVSGKEVAVHEEVVLRKTFGQLKHYVREGVDSGQRLLIDAPMSGHY